MLRLATGFLIVTALAASPAWSQGYVGAAIGQSRLESTSETSAKAFAGYQFKPSFAIEGGYQSLGSVSIAGRSADISAWDVGFIGAWELGNRFALLGRVGVYRAETSGAGTNLGPVFGLGASYELTQSAAFRLEWQRFDKLGPDTQPSLDIDVISIGAVFRF